jgi:hypothetical protein
MLNLVGAAAGSDLLICVVKKINRSQPAAAPTGGLVFFLQPLMLLNCLAGFL